MSQPFGRRVVWLVVALAPCLAGCSSEPFSYVPVKGKVTYSDGTLIPGDQITLRFVPEQMQTKGKDVAPAPTGDVNVKDGTFAGVTTHQYLDGAMVGKYRVTINVMKNTPQGQQPNGAVPARYQSPETTPLTADVTGKNDELTFLVDKPKS